MSQIQTQSKLLTTATACQSQWRLQFLALTLLGLMLCGESSAQTLIASRMIHVYGSKFICGLQGQSGINSDTDVEAGRYQTSVGMFNPNNHTLSNVAVFASIPGNPAVFVDTVTILPSGTALINCKKILNALFQNGTPRAVVGFISVKRTVDDLEMQTTYTRTVPGGATIDVEHIEPRQQQSGLIKIQNEPLS